MESVIGRDSIVFSANRWLVGLLVLAAGGAGALLLQPGLLNYLRVTNFRRSLAFVGYVPPDLRVLVIQAIALVVLAAGLVLCRFILDPRMVTVNATGIQVRELFRTTRGRWRDFAAIKPIGTKGRKTIQFQFRKATGFNTMVRLPTAPLAVDNRAVVGTIAEWIMDSKAALPPGFLDKYDPKKIHAASAAAAVPVEKIMEEHDAAEAPIPVAFAPAPRRSFGKRTAA